MQIDEHGFAVKEEEAIKLYNGENICAFAYIGRIDLYYTAFADLDAYGYRYIYTFNREWRVISLHQ